MRRQEVPALKILLCNVVQLCLLWMTADSTERPCVCVFVSSAGRLLVSVHSVAERPWHLDAGALAAPSASAELPRHLLTNTPQSSQVTSTASAAQPHQSRKNKLWSLRKKDRFAVYVKTLPPPKKKMHPDGWVNYWCESWDKANELL